jgi:hypothetical protein
MEYISYIWHEIKARLWEGEVVSLLLVCHEKDYAKCLGLAHSLRIQLDSPVSVKQAGTLEVGDEPTKIERGTVFTIVEMSESMFRDAYFSIGKLEEGFEA